MVVYEYFVNFLRTRIESFVYLPHHAKAQEKLYLANDYFNNKIEWFENIILAYIFPWWNCKPYWMQWITRKNVNFDCTDAIIQFTNTKGSLKELDSDHSASV